MNSSFLRNIYFKFIKYQFLNFNYLKKMFFFNRSFNPKLIEQYHEKMKNDELTIKYILDNEDLIQEIKTDSIYLFFNQMKFLKK